MKLEEEVIELFVNIIKIERDGEILKQYLNDNSQFEPYGAFTRIDRFDKGYIDKNDIINFLKDNNHFVGHKDKRGVSLFVEYYDRDFDGRISFDEILHCIVNKTNPLLRALTTQKLTFKTPYNKFLNTEVEDLLSRLLLNSIQLFEYADKKKLEIFCTKFSLLDLFILLDINKDGFINAEDLDIFLRNRQVVLYKEEIEALISLYDDDLDGKWNWNEFLFMMLPSKESYNYNYSDLRHMETEYNEIFHFSLRKEHLLKANKSIGNSNSAEDDHISDNEIQSRFLNTLPTINQKNYDSYEPIVNYDTYEPINNNYSYLNSKENYNDKIFASSKYTGFSDTMTRDYTPEYINQLELFTNEFYNLICLDRDIENIKTQLAMNENFNLITIFNFFDKFKMDYVSFDTFISGMQFFNVVSFPNTKDAELLFKKYDKYLTGKLKYIYYYDNI